MLGTNFDPSLHGPGLSRTPASHQPTCVRSTWLSDFVPSNTGACFHAIHWRKYFFNEQKPGSCLFVFVSAFFLKVYWSAAEKMMNHLYLDGHAKGTPYSNRWIQMSGRKAFKELKVARLESLNQMWCQRPLWHLKFFFFSNEHWVLPATDRIVPAKSKNGLEIKNIKSAPPLPQNKSVKNSPTVERRLPWELPWKATWPGRTSLEWIGPLLREMLNEA